MTVDEIAKEIEKHMPQDTGEEMFGMKIYTWRHVPEGTAILIVKEPT